MRLKFSILRQNKANLRTLFLNVRLIVRFILSKKIKREPVPFGRSLQTLKFYGQLTRLHSFFRFLQVHDTGNVFDVRELLQILEAEML